MRAVLSLQTQTDPSTAAAAVLQSADQHVDWGVMSCAVAVHAVWRRGALADSRSSQGVETWAGLVQKCLLKRTADAYCCTLVK